MTCNFLNYESDLKQAIEGVSDDKSGSAWCIFEYEGNSNIIRVGCVGSDGLEELTENLSAAKVQYGFVAVKCENQTKIVLIHWQGDGVPAIRRSQTTPHLAEVQRFARSVHLTIYARNEEDIEPATIYEQLTKSGSVTQPAKVKTTIPPDVAPKQVAVCRPAPVSTNGESAAKTTRAWIPPPPKTVIAMNTVPPSHSNVNVGLDERTKFWQEMRAEEEQRRKEDAIRQEEQRKQYALERCQLEAQLHEALLAKNAAVVAQKMNNGTTVSQKKSSANDLIAGRRLIFEQKLAEIAATIPKPLTKRKDFKFQVGISKQDSVASQQNTSESQQSKEEIETPSVKSVLQQFNQPDNGQSTQQQKQQNCVKMNEQQQGQHINCTNSQEQQQQREKVKYQEQTTSPELPTLVVQPMLKIDEPDNPDQRDLVKQTEEFSIEKTSCSASICVRALWDYQAEDDSEITFDPGDIITDVEMVHEDWWRGRTKNDTVGLFPSNFVEIL